MKAADLFKPIRLSIPISTGLLLVRVVVGLAFMFHGYRKIQNPFGWMGQDANVPGLFQALAALSEFGGGFAWILGVITPIACLGIGCTMATAIYTHMVIRGDPFVRSGAGSSYELALVFFSVAVLLFLAGPGRFSLDRLIFGEGRKTERA